MRFFLLLVSLICFSARAQDLDELRRDLQTTALTDLEAIEKKAGKILEIDPFHDFANYFLSEAYRFARKPDKVREHYSNLIAEHPGNPVPYLLRAIHQHRHISLMDTSRLADLRRALALDPTSREANYHLMCRLRVLIHGEWVVMLSAYISLQIWKIYVISLLIVISL